MHISGGSVVANDGSEYSYSSEYPDIDMSLVCVSAQALESRLLTALPSPIYPTIHDISIKSFPSQSEPTDGYFNCAS